eukprot:5645139-Amphidinium_carterae.1
MPQKFTNQESEGYGRSPEGGFGVDHKRAMGQQKCTEPQREAKVDHERAIDTSRVPAHCSL